MSKRRKKKKIRIRWDRIIVSLIIVGALLFGVYKSLSFVIDTVISFFQGEEIIEIHNEEKNPKQDIDNPIGTVIIDPGHGGMDAGTKKGTYYEKDIVLKASKIVQEELEDQNIKVILTREEDETLDPKNKINDLKMRAGFSKTYQANYFVSIHVNAYEKSNDISGFEIYVRNDESQSLANAVGKQIEDLNLSQNRGIVNGKHLQVLRDNTVPSILIELGYINGKDYDYLSDDTKIDLLSKAISKGIIETIKK